MFMLDKDMQILRVIANSSSQTISHEHIFLEAKKTSGMEEDQVEESLKTLELNGLVGRRGDLYYTTTKGSIIARKGMSL
jgi:predicted transcriptional regulator